MPLIVIKANSPSADPDPACLRPSRSTPSVERSVNSGASPFATSQPPGLLARGDAMLVALNERLHVVAAFTLLSLAILILVDVVARGVFSRPIAGTSEIVSNAIVGIAFLQLAQAIRCGGFLRVEMLDGVLPPAARRAMFQLACLLGALLFAAVAYSAWGPMVEAWHIGEYDGVDGSIKVPTAPIRSIVVFASALASVNFAALLLRAIGSGEVLNASEAA